MAVLQGSAEFAAALRALPVDIEKKVLRKSAISGARVVRDRIKVTAPVASAIVRRGSKPATLPGTLKRAIVLKFAPERSSNEAQTYVVAVRHGNRQQKYNRDAFYWLWVEKGHRIRQSRKGPSTGEVPPHPFFVPAYRATADQARQTMADAGGVALAAAITAAGLKG